MNNLFDNHNHSQFSFDGKNADIEKGARSAMASGLGGICFSDHCDFYVPPEKALHEELVPEEFDAILQQAEIDRVQAMLDREGKAPKILKGIEVGMHAECHEQIRKKLSENSFDQIIASIHYIGETDPFHGGYYRDKDWKQAYGTYLETIWREMTWLKDFDIMGHFDYVVRYAQYEQCSIMYKDFSDIFDEMFRFIIQEGKALEINTKSYQDFDGRRPLLDKNVLLRYKEMGGEILSLGSDSHNPSCVGTDLAKFAAMLKEMGFRWIAHYEKRKLIQLAL